MKEYSDKQLVRAGDWSGFDVCSILPNDFISLLHSSTFYIVLNKRKIYGLTEGGHQLCRNSYRADRAICI